MNGIQKSRNDYYHVPKARPAPPIKNQESVEEWQLRTGEKPTQIAIGETSYKNDKQKKLEYGRAQANKKRAR